MTPKGKKILKTASAFAMMTGIISVFVGLYVMASGMAITDDITIQEMNAMKKISAVGMYIMVNGAVNAFAGFVGFLNCGELEYSKKCCKYGYVLLGFALANVIVLLIFVKTWKILSILIIIVPTVIAVTYYLGAYLNHVQEKEVMVDQIHEDENDGNKLE